MVKAYLVMLTEDAKVKAITILMAAPSVPHIQLGVFEGANYQEAFRSALDFLDQMTVATINLCRRLEESKCPSVI